MTTYIPWSIAKGTGLLQEEVPHQFGIHGVLGPEWPSSTRTASPTNSPAS